MSKGYRISFKIIIDIIMGTIPLVFVIVKNQLGIDAVSFMF